MQIDLQEAAAVLRPRDRFPEEWRDDPIACDFDDPKKYEPVYIGLDFTADTDQARALLLAYGLAWVKGGDFQRFYDVGNALTDLCGCSKLNLDISTRATVGIGLMALQDNPGLTLWQAIKEANDA
jgi:hypothetical protein